MENPDLSKQAQEVIFSRKTVKQQFHKCLKIFDKFKIDIQILCNIPMES